MSRRWRRAPLRLRLVSGFVVIMAAVLLAAGAVVFWRVRLALDTTLDEELAAARAGVLRAADQGSAEPTALVDALPPGTLAQVLDARAAVLASTPAAGDRPLPAPARSLLTGGKSRLREVRFPLPGQGRTAVVAVRLGQRDEALRELLLQLVVANGLALAAAAAVGYALAGSALRPVERYRSQAAQIAAGASGLRLEVSPDVDDEITRLGHTLNAMLAAQEAAAERQRRLLADASHELRAPLTILSAEVELALRRPRTAAEHEATLQQVALDTGRLVTLAEQLLALESAGVREGVPTDLPTLVEACVTATRGRLERVRTVHADVEAGLVVSLASGAGELVLRNLLDNAVLHGRGVLRVTARRYGRCAVLAVSDQGDGPPAEFVPRAAERFARADPARTGPGTGLGLALVHALVTGSGGELRLCTPAGHHRFAPALPDAPPCQHTATGTVVSVVLPTVG